MRAFQRITRFFPVVALFVLVSVAALTTAGASASSGASVGDQLTLSRPSPPTSLDPAKMGIASLWTSEPAYDSLIYQDGSGAFKPGLALSWDYVGKGNTEFKMTLRKGVKFSDGSPLTATVVKNWLLYFKGANGQNASQATFIDTITTKGLYDLTIHLNGPDPQLALKLSQNYLMGNVPSGPALANPTILATRTFGAGPYMLDPDQTVAGSNYTYVPNPNYWNKSRVHYRKLVIKIITDPNAVLNALRTGQIDYSEGDPSTSQAAASAGLRVLHAPSNVTGLVLADRAGAKVPALKDVRVRQAINYAIDRKAIAQALFGRNGAATSQITGPGWAGYDPSLDKKYPYDQAKAKQLLAAAGYSNGFTIPVGSTPVASIDLVTQAIAASLSKVGIKLDIKSEPATQYSANLRGGTYPVYTFNFGLGTYYTQANSMYLFNAVLNPFHSQNRTMNNLFNEAAKQRPAAAAPTWRKLAAQINDRAWFATTALIHRFYYARTTVAGVRWDGATAVPNIVDFYPAPGK